MDAFLITGLVVLVEDCDDGEEMLASGGGGDEEELVDAGEMLLPLTTCAKVAFGMCGVIRYAEGLELNIFHASRTVQRLSNLILLTDLCFRKV